MGELQSARFTQGDAATVKRLEDCATGRPSEVASHFTVGQTNPAVTKLQEALKEVQQRNPGLGIPAFEVSGTYDQNFANAIFAYKTKRDIRNFANRFDNIVGIKTIKSLDSEKGPKTNPAPLPDPKKKPGEFPRQLPNCVPSSLCPPSKEFDVTLMAGVSGGEGVELARYFFIIRDTTNGLSAVYRLDAGGAGFGSPFSVAGGGGLKHFSVGTEVRVTSFGPFGSIASASKDAAIVKALAFLVLGFTPVGKIPRPTAPMLIDSGPIPVPGISLHAGRLLILTRCGQEAGASKRTLGASDLPI